MLRNTVLALALGSAMLVASNSSVTAADTPPRVFLLNPAGLTSLRAAARNGDPTIQPALAALRDRGDVALSHQSASVTEKQVPPPSGDAHDYVSLSIYWWPNPASPSGLPYIQRDGVRNPEADDTSRYDANPLTRMVGDVDSFQENAQTLTRAATAYPGAGYQDVLSQLAADRSPVDLLRLTLGYWPD